MAIQSDTWRVLGDEAGMSVTHLFSGALSGTTPVVGPSASTGVDLRTKGRRRLLVVAGGARTAGSVTITVTESATTNGTYATATTSGTLTALSASGVKYCTVKRNPAKPFLRVTATGDGAPADWAVSAYLVAY